MLIEQKCTNLIEQEMCTYFVLRHDAPNDSWDVIL